ncbi:hypothetical protein D1007_21107 [Hordeum vulgare]|nr:hypothetical protein D1007_21107 [Hordeum vulgare]
MKCHCPLHFFLGGHPHISIAFVPLLLPVLSPQNNLAGANNGIVHPLHTCTVYHATHSQTYKRTQSHSRSHSHMRVAELVNLPQHAINPSCVSYVHVVCVYMCECECVCVCVCCAWAKIPTYTNTMIGRGHACMGWFINDFLREGVPKIEMKKSTKEISHDSPYPG